MNPVDHILVVDGDRAVARILGALLRPIRGEVRVVSASDAAALAAVFGQFSWAALVLDPATTSWISPIRMIETFRARAPDVPVIVWSEQMAPKDALELPRHGVQLVPLKSFESLVALPTWLGWSEIDESGIPSPLATARRPSPGPRRSPYKAPAPRPSNPGADSEIEEPSLAALASPFRATQVPDPVSRFEPIAMSSGGFDPLTVSRSRAGPEPSAELVHDLKEPLRAIEQLLDRCEKRHREILPQDAKSLIQSARRSAQQLTEQIEESVRPGPSPVQIVDGNQVLIESLVHLESIRRETGARITHDVLPHLAVPPTGLRRIFENLLGNAMRYRGAEEPEIHVSAQLLDDEVIVSVADNGRGIPRVLQDPLFEPGIKGPDGGAGIGLSSVRRIVESWGGEVWFDTVVGEGSTFFVSAPLAGGVASGSRLPRPQKI